MYEILFSKKYCNYIVVLKAYPDDPVFMGDREDCEEYVNENS